MRHVEGYTHIRRTLTPLVRFCLGYGRPSHLAARIVILILSHFCMFLLLLSLRPLFQLPYDTSSIFPTIHLSILPFYPLFFILVPTKLSTLSPLLPIQGYLFFLSFLSPSIFFPIRRGHYPSVSSPSLYALPYLLFHLLTTLPPPFSFTPRPPKC